MTATLQQTLLTPGTLPQVTTDCRALIDQQVSETSGFSGAAVKVAYKTVNSVLPGHITHVVASLVPDMVGQLEPYWADFATTGGADFGDYLAKRGDEVAQALLTVTDERAAGSGRAVVTKAYGSVRGSAAKHVTAALPALGALVQKHAG